MTRLIRIAAVVMVLLASTTTHLSAEMSCEQGLGVYSPITGQIADCLAGGGDDCLSCTVVDRT
jgi:hypothetical protein